MANDRPDVAKRRFLRRATGVLGSIEAVAAGTPFMLSMKAGARVWAEGALVEVDFGKLESRQIFTAVRRRKPVFIVRRTPGMLATLERNRDLLADPDSRVQSEPPPCARNLYRSIEPEVQVVMTHLGCVPAQHFEAGSASDFGADWPGGFCHCHGSKFDLTGRVFKRVPAPTNLVVSLYSFLGEARRQIGADRAAGDTDDRA